MTDALCTLIAARVKGATRSAKTQTAVPLLPLPKATVLLKGDDLVCNAARIGYALSESYRDL